MDAFRKGRAAARQDDTDQVDAEQAAFDLIDSLDEFEFDEYHDKIQYLAGYIAQIKIVTSAQVAEMLYPGKEVTPNSVRAARRQMERWEVHPTLGDKPLRYVLADVMSAIDSHGNRHQFTVTGTMEEFTKLLTELVLIVGKGECGYAACNRSATFTITPYGYRRGKAIGWIRNMKIIIGSKEFQLTKIMVGEK